MLRKHIIYKIIIHALKIFTYNFSYLKNNERLFCFYKFIEKFKFVENGCL